MKAKLFSIFILTSLLTSCYKDDNKNKHDIKILPDISSSKDETMKSKELVADFDEIVVAQSIEAEIIKADHEKVVVFAPSNILDEIIIQKEGSVLSLHYKSGVRVTNSNKVKAKIYLKDFTKLTANSGAEIKIKDQYTQEKTILDASSSGEIFGDLEANDLQINLNSSGSYKGKIWAVNLEVEASSSGSLDASGKSKNSAVTASSGSDVNLSKVITEYAKLEASSGSEIKIGVISSLEAESSSGASINVSKKGDVKIIKKEQSSGGNINIQ